MPAVARDGRIAVADSTGFRLPAPENGHAYLSNQDGQWLLELDGQVARLPGQLFQRVTRA